MPLARSRNLRPFPRRALAAGLALGALLFPGAAEIARAAVDSCPDALITADVKARLAARSPTGALKINVETDDCVVTLKGCAETSDFIKKAVAVAKKVKKVKAVKSRLTVCPE